MLLVPNRDVVIPFGGDIRLQRDVNLLADSRFENRAVFACNNTTTINLSFTPVIADWVEIFVDGFRVLNPRVAGKQGGWLYERYNVEGRTITFTEPISGSVTVVCDTRPVPQRNASIIEVDNVQGFRSARASLYIEPVIVAEPVNGYARLSTDRMSMVYLPKTGFVGGDSFSYCLINNHGQYSKNYCVYISVS